MQSEPPTLKAHQHAPEVIPGDFATIDNKQGDAAVTDAVPLDPSSNDARVRYLEPVFAFREVLDGQGAQYLNRQVKVFRRTGDPIISVDTKKK